MTIRPATRADAAWIATRLRPEDVEEVRAGTAGREPKWIIERAFELCREIYVVELQPFQPYAIFGIVDSPHRKHSAVVWMLSTPEITKARIATLKAARTVIAEWLRHCVVLYNRVYLPNTLHVRWLQILGAEFGAVEGDFQHFMFRGGPPSCANQPASSSA